jgi:hypothetical protein
MPRIQWDPSNLGWQSGEISRTCTEHRLLVRDDPSPRRRRWARITVHDDGAVIGTSALSRYTREYDSLEAAKASLTPESLPMLLRSPGTGHVTVPVADLRELVDRARDALESIEKEADLARWDQPRDEADAAAERANSLRAAIEAVAAHLKA